jgi:hypothetical protein
LDNKSIGDRKETRYPRDRREYVRSETSHAEKHGAGNEDIGDRKEPAIPATVVSTSEARRLMLRSTAPVMRTIPTTSAIQLLRRVLAYSSVLVGCMVARYPRPFSLCLGACPAILYRVPNRNRNGCIADL